MPNTNKPTNALEQMKYEVANEIGIQDYAHADKANMTSRDNGRVGGNMVKKMIAFAEKNLANH